MQNIDYNNPEHMRWLMTYIAWYLDEDDAEDDAEDNEFDDWD